MGWLTKEGIHYVEHLTIILRRKRCIILKQIDAKNIVICLFSSFAVSMFPVTFLYFTNIDEVAIKDTVSGFFLSLVVMFFCVSVMMLLLKDLYKASLLADLFFVLIMNYALIENFVVYRFHNIKYWHIAPVSIVVMLHIAYIIHKKLPDDFFCIGVKILGLVFSFLILLNVFVSIPTILTLLQGQPDRVNAEEENADDTLSDKGVYPNIYYLLFDEYSNFPVLEKYYQYDNLPLRSFLEKNTFTISLDSHNETYATVVVTTNNLNIDYVATSTLDYSEFRTDPQLFKILDSYGYSVQYLSDGVPVRWKGNDFGKGEATTVDGLGFWDIFVQKTIFYPFLISDKGNEYQEAFYEQFNFLNRCIKATDHNSFVYVHFMAPHMPFVFNENGGYVGMANRNNTEDNQYYLGQLKYTTVCMLDSIEMILEKDPDSIIILQSDHSNRYIGKPLGQGSLSTEDEMKNILNAVYYQGNEIPEICGLSSVNTLRIVLNKVLGESFEILEVPAYG